MIGDLVPRDGGVQAPRKNSSSAIPFSTVTSSSSQPRSPAGVVEDRCAPGRSSGGISRTMKAPDDEDRGQAATHQDRLDDRPRGREVGLVECRCGRGGAGRRRTRRPSRPAPAAGWRRRTRGCRDRMPQRERRARAHRRRTTTALTIWRRRKSRADCRWSRGVMSQSVWRSWSPSRRISQTVAARTVPKPAGGRSHTPARRVVG